MHISLATLPSVRRWVRSYRARLVLVSATIWLAGCPEPPLDDFLYEERFTEVPTCDSLFGIPGEKTGLPDVQCMPKVRCDCAKNCEGEMWTAPQYFIADVAALREWRLVGLPDGVSVAPGEHFAPRSLMGADPYDAEPQCETDLDCLEGEVCDPPVCRPTNKFCGILPLQDGIGDYVLVTYGSEIDALDAGALTTHRGPCGLCSSLEDLAVYIEFRDLTDPVRNCGAVGFVNSNSRLKCIEGIGFSGPCAEIWAFNTANTGEVCRLVCGAAFSSSHNQPSGEINSCLACDETKSGAIFKAVAGRTRRASGLPSAICRPGRAVYPVEHFYSPRSGGL